MRSAIVILGIALCAARPASAGKTLQQLQSEFLGLKFGMFVHFNMGTFTNEEWATPGQSPNTFNPTSLNCGQWADAATAAGMKYMTLVTKHHDGFCLFDSALTDYKSTAMKAGCATIRGKMTARPTP